MPHSAPGRAPERLALRILVVDDDRDTAVVMCELLRERGHSVRSAGGVQEALERAAEAPVDLLLSDITLPDGTGLELMRELNRHAPLRGIAVSGLAAEGAVAASLAAGFAKHLVKPVSLDRMLEEIESKAAVAVERH